MAQFQCLPLIMQTAQVSLLGLCIRKLGRFALEEIVLLRSPVRKARLFLLGAQTKPQASGSFALKLLNFAG